MSDTPRADKAVVSAEFIRREMDYYTYKFVLVDVARELERENAALRETVELLLPLHDAMGNEQLAKIARKALEGK